MDAVCPDGQYLSTVALLRGRVAIFRATPQGLQWESSSDGVTWRHEAPEPPPDELLQPICPALESDAVTLFCADPAGRIIPLALPKGDFTRSDAFHPVPDPGKWYEAAPTPRDLAIVPDPRNRVWRAFFGARRRMGRDPRRRACIGVATSPDLRHWVVEPPVFAPNLFPTIRSPHVLTHQGRTVLFYTAHEYARQPGIRFAIAPRLDGPFERPQPDLLARDIRSSVHSVPLDARRLLFFVRALRGAPPACAVSRPGQLDFHPDGRPFVRFYDPLLRLLDHTLLQTDAALASSEILVRVLPRFGTDFRLTARVRGLGATHAGLAFRTTLTGHDNITLWLEFAAGAVTVRRGANGRLLGRAIRKLAPGADHRVAVWAEGPFADIYLDDEWLLSVHTEARTSGGFGLAVAGGEARFDAVTAQNISAQTTP